MKPKWEKGELNIDVYLMCSWKEKVKWDSRPDRKFCKGSEENSVLKGHETKLQRIYAVDIMYSHGQQRFMLRKMSSATVNECS